MFRLPLPQGVPIRANAGDPCPACRIGRLEAANRPREIRTIQTMSGPIFAPTPQRPMASCPKCGFGS